MLWAYLNSGSSSKVETGSQPVLPTPRRRGEVILAHASGTITAVLAALRQPSQGSLLAVWRTE